MNTDTARRALLRRTARVGLSLAVCLCAADARAQKLTVQGDRFAIDGTPRFLTFITYFGAMGAPNATADLHVVKSLGFDGVRIWPNLDTGPQLMNGDGSLRSDELARLRSILDQARQERLVVDVTFTYEHIAGMTPATARIGIAAAADALRGYENLIFDIQNERNVGDRRFMSETDVGRIFAAVKATDPARIATASNAPVNDAQYAADFAARLGLDVTAYHEPRPANWYQADFVQGVVRAMRSNGKPAYMQEPMATRDSLFAYPSNSRAEYFLQAIANAKLAGAAAWCFHTEVGVDFRSGAPLLEDRLHAYAEPEWAFVTAMKPRVVFRTSNGVNYLVAESGGGAGVRADRTAAGPGSWEVIGVADLTGGPLVSGDRVALAAADGTHYLQAVGGGGGALRASSDSVGAFETFTIEKAGTGIIRHGDSVALRAGDGARYVVADGGGGGSVNVTSTARGAWETFTMLYVTPHITEGAAATANGPARRPGGAQ
jgi:hypothetical protein